MSKIRKGNPHKDQMDVEISRLSKLGGLSSDIAADPLFYSWRKKKVPSKAKKLFNRAMVGADAPRAFVAKKLKKKKK